MNHKRKRARSKKCVCPLCKPAQHKRLNSMLKDIASQVDTVHLDPDSERVLRENLWELYR